MSWRYSETSLLRTKRGGQASVTLKSPLQQAVNNFAWKSSLIYPDQFNQVSCSRPWFRFFERGTGRSATMARSVVILVSFRNSDHDTAERRSTLALEIVLLDANNCLCYLLDRDFCIFYVDKSYIKSIIKHKTIYIYKKH